VDILESLAKKGEEVEKVRLVRIGRDLIVVLLKRSFGASVVRRVSLRSMSNFSGPLSRIEP